MKEYSRNAFIAGVTLSFVLLSPISVLAQTATSSGGFSIDVATTTPDSNFSKHIKTPEEAQGWRNYLNGWLAWAQSQTNLPSSSLQSARYSQNNFENNLLNAGYIQELNGSITTSKLGLNSSIDNILALRVISQ